MFSLMTQTQQINKKKLFIWNLDWGVSSEGLKEVFSKWWEVVDAIVIKDKMNWKSKGFGFVEYATEEDAQRAKEEANWGEINGRAINVDFSKESEKKDRPMRDNRGPRRSFDRRNNE